MPKDGAARRAANTGAARSHVRDFIPLVVAVVVKYFASDETTPRRTLSSRASALASRAVVMPPAEDPRDVQRALAEDGFVVLRPSADDDAAELRPPADSRAPTDGVSDGVSAPARAWTRVANAVWGAYASALGRAAAEDLASSLLTYDPEERLAARVRFHARLGGRVDLDVSGVASLRPCHAPSPRRRAPSLPRLPRHERLRRRRVLLRGGSASSLDPGRDRLQARRRDAELAPGRGLRGGGPGEDVRRVPRARRGDRTRWAPRDRPRAARARERPRPGPGRAPPPGPGATAARGEGGNRRRRRKRRRRGRRRPRGATTLSIHRGRAGDDVRDELPVLAPRAGEPVGEREPVLRAVRGGVASGERGEAAPCKYYAAPRGGRKRTRGRRGRGEWPRRGWADADAWRYGRRGRNVFRLLTVG